MEELFKSAIAIFIKSASDGIFNFSIKSCNKINKVQHAIKNIYIEKHHLTDQLIQSIQEPITISLSLILSRKSLIKGMEIVDLVKYNKNMLVKWYIIQITEEGTENVPSWSINRPICPYNTAEHSREGEKALQILDLDFRWMA
jgi:hypothetical protein